MDESQSVNSSLLLLKILFSWQSDQTSKLRILFEYYSNKGMEYKRQIVLTKIYLYSFSALGTIVSK